MKNMICIVCPKGCHLIVEDDMKISGNACEKGAQYAIDELTAPVRVVTSTVSINNATHKRCPVKTNGAIPKSLVIEATKTLNNIFVNSPISLGDVVVKNVCGTGIDFVATRDM